MVKGIIHVHTKEFSYDAKVSFGDIKKFCKKMRYNFVALTEHSESMSKEKMKELIKKCKEASEKNLIFIPGVEFLTEEGYEVLGIGIKKFLCKTSLKKTVEFIQRNGGVAILAHPSKYKKDLKTLTFDGIEILNFEYNGFFPLPYSLKLFKKMTRKNKKVFGIFGLDVHRKIHFRNIFLETKSRINEKDIIKNLKEGNFINKTSFIVLGPSNCNGKMLKFFCYLNYIVYSFLKFFGVSIFKIFRKIKIIR